jgi:Tol biopolymer transport system component
MAGVRIGGTTISGINSLPYVILELDGYYNIWQIINGTAVQVSLDSADIDDVRQNPVLSPDGSQILFEKKPDSGGLEVWVIDSDGSNETLIDGDEASNEFAQYPQWSPDSSTVIYTWNDQGSTFGGEIRTANPDGTGISTLWTPPTGAFARRPTYSADGTKVAFLVNDDGIGTPTYTPPNLWTMDDDGTNDSNIDNLLASHFDQCQFAWANLSNVLAYYEGNNSSPAIGGIHKINADGSGKTLLAIDSDGTLFQAMSNRAWLPDDSAVIFSVFDSLMTMHIALADGSDESDFYTTHHLGGVTGTLRTPLIYQGRVWFTPSEGSPRFEMSSVTNAAADYQVGQDITDGGVGDVFYEETAYFSR